jgi:hypothetical protein
MGHPSCGLSWVRVLGEGVFPGSTCLQTLRNLGHPAQNDTGLRAGVCGWDFHTEIPERCSGMTAGGTVMVDLWSSWRHSHPSCEEGGAPREGKGRGWMGTAPYNEGLHEFGMG